MRALSDVMLLGGVSLGGDTSRLMWAVPALRCIRGFLEMFVHLPFLSWIPLLISSKRCSRSSSLDEGYLWIGLST